jgi:AcrR family transcriptional regulator
LLDAVVEEAMAHGIADQSLRSIAAAVGTSHRMLLHHFGSKEALFVEVIRAVEARQRQVLVELGDAGADEDPLAAGQRFWAHLCDPALAPQERLFFEVYGQALVGRTWATPLLDGIVDEWVTALVGWLDPEGDHPAAAQIDARLMVAVTRGLLLDLLATGDRTAVDAAMERFTELCLVAGVVPTGAPGGP